LEPIVALCVALIVRSPQQRNAVGYLFIGVHCATFTVTLPASAHDDFQVVFDYHFSINLVCLLSMQRASVLKAYKYRIYPTDAQMVFFAKTFGCCRFVWNKMLDEKLRAYKKKERIQRITPTKYKNEFSFLREVDSFALCNVQLKLEKAFKDHFRNRKQFKLPKIQKEKRQTIVHYKKCAQFHKDRF
jgi:hypothetical protein